MKAAAFFLSLFCVLAALALFARLVCSPFSTKISAEMRAHPALHCLWGFFAFLGVLMFIDPFASFWPPVAVERHAQRAEVLARVQSAGGWDVVRRGCIDLAERHTNGFYSNWHDTNSLPAALVALHPLLVECQPQLGYLRIRVFGVHHTGGHSTPYFGLVVDISTNSPGHPPGTGNEKRSLPGSYHYTFDQVAEGIYEVY